MRNHHHLRERAMVVALALGSACACAHDAAAPPSVAPAPPPAAPRAALAAPSSEPSPRERLPEAARAMLRDRMGRHADDAAGLREATLRLDYPAIEWHARQIATEPRVARPGPGGLDTLNAAIPDSFYAEQDALRAAALALADAAQRRDDTGLGWAYGRVSQTCVSCHARFLKPAGGNALPAKKLSP